MLVWSIVWTPIHDADHYVGVFNSVILGFY